MRRFYAPNDRFHDYRFELDNEQTKHLRNVLRLRISDEVKVFNGKGNEFLCLVQEFSHNKKTCYLRIVKEIEATSPESNLNLNLAVSVLKGDKFDLAIQKAVEIGVNNFTPIVTKRCNVRLRKIANKLQRWQKIIIEASKQCGRAKLMEIIEPLEFKECIENTKGAKILFSERDGESFSEINEIKHITAIIGSEGGWEDSELEFAKQKGVQIITFGGRVLRAETAAISIPAILQHRFGDLN